MIICNNLGFCVFDLVFVVENGLRIIQSTRNYVRKMTRKLWKLMMEGKDKEHGKGEKHKIKNTNIQKQEMNNCVICQIIISFLLVFRSD